MCNASGCLASAARYDDIINGVIGGRLPASVAAIGALGPINFSSRMKAMRVTLPLEEAILHAGLVPANRRVVVALIGHADTYWWGGHIDNWRPDETLFSSGSALTGYRKLVDRFKKGKTAKAHILMFHNDGSFGAVMLGVESKEEAQQLLFDSLEEIRIRTSD
ncbi:hypothetical protein QFZ94_000158 [Paraburkholderia sp. JPY465]|uniref:hypothetical protein n=1 Tax=Paraburkholderia sp. JPY465 TaxID=3042285 RepID=UPI003D1BD5C2